MAQGLGQFTEKNAGLVGDLLDEVVAQNNGQWMEVIGMDKITIHVIITGTATVYICGSNQDSPANTDHGIDLVGAITSSDMVVVKAPLKYIKARVSAWTSGTVSAHLVAV